MGTEGQARGGLGCLSGLALPCPRGQASEGHPVGLAREQRVCGQGCSRKGRVGRPDSLSLAQLHFQKFLLPVRRDKDLGSLSGCSEGVAKWEQVSQSSHGPGSRSGASCLATGSAQPWDRGWAPAGAARELTRGAG